MNTAMTLVGVAVALVYALWLYFLAVMCLKRANNVLPLSGVTRAFALSVLWIGYALDFLVNALVMTILLLEFPSEWLVTSRLKRHIRDTGLRGVICRWIDDTLIEPFDPGHCK